MPMVYVAILIFVLLLLGGVWYLQGSPANRGSDFSVSFTPVNQNPAEVLLTFGLRKLEIYSDRARWLAFAGIFLLIIEIFAVVVYFLKYNTMSGRELESYYYLGGLIYFMCIIISIFTSLRMITLSRDIPPVSEHFMLSRQYWHSKVQEMGEDQRRQLSFYLLEKNHQLEILNISSIFFIASTLTLLAVWFVRWLMTVSG